MVNLTVPVPVLAILLGISCIGYCKPTVDFQKIREEISNYKDVANEIIQLALHGKAQNESYNRLAKFVDTYGNRIAGSQNLENAIDYMLDQMKADGLENVHGEAVMVPHWVRGEETAMLMEPRNYKMSILGLGNSVSTPPDGITAEALVVRSFDELKQKAAQAKGKIIVYDQGFVSYGVSVKYRAIGASEAAKVGGVASLIRSVTPFSIYSPHTGIQEYESGVPKIPTASITVEDAEMLRRMSDRGTKIVIKLKMDDVNMPPTKSRNTVAEIVGSTHPEQVVLVSGHLDSWDVGQGAMDDGGGAFISWEALSLVKQLGLRPKRTLRAVLWTSEEQGGVGSQQYFEAHKVNQSNFDLVMESDIGTFTPLGIGFTGSAQAKAIIKQVVRLLAPLNASKLFDSADGTDIAPWVQIGVPGASLYDDYSTYFYYHHSNGDTMTVQSPHQMNLCAAVWAITSYVVADMDEMLPRN